MQTSLLQQTAFSLEELEQSVHKLSGSKVLIVGDVMLDEYLSGDADRISPEAPVPVVFVEEDSFFVGGAGNVAGNVTSLGGVAALIGVSGNDAAGEMVDSCLEKAGVIPCLVKDTARKTTVKTRVMARKQQMLRIDREDTSPLSLPIVDNLVNTAAEHMEDAGCLIFSDYGKGVICNHLAQRLVPMAKERKIPVLVDPKPVNKHIYQGITLMTPNTKETGEISGMPVKNKDEIIAAGRKIMDLTGSPCLITTLGADGMAVFTEDGGVTHIATMARQVFDVTGAGDTVISVTGLGLASGIPLIGASLLANFAAGIVVGKVGAATVSQEALIKAIHEKNEVSLSKWV